MKAFHGKESIKKEYLNRVKLHRKADEAVGVALFGILALVVSFLLLAVK